MSVRELREILTQFEDEDEVMVRGGEDEYGEWAQLSVCHDGEDHEVMSDSAGV